MHNAKYNNNNSDNVHNNYNIYIYIMYAYYIYNIIYNYINNINIFFARLLLTIIRSNTIPRSVYTKPRSVDTKE